MGWFDKIKGFTGFESFESRNTRGFKLYKDGDYESHVTYPKNGGSPHVTIRNEGRVEKRGYPHMKGYEWLDE